MAKDKTKVELDSRELEVVLSALDELGYSVSKMAYSKEEDKESYLKEIKNLETYLGKVLNARGGWGEY